MTRPHLSRRAVLGVAASGVSGSVLAVGSLAPWPSRYVKAQLDPGQSGTEPTLENEDPALAGTDPSQALSSVVPAVPATPIVTPESSIPGPTWEPTDAGMTTSLGGSDIAVASEGESHQVDAPKRKANKIMGENKRP